MAKQQMSQEDVDSLIARDIVDIMGLSHLEEKKKQELRGKILQTVQSRAFNRIVSELKKKNKVEDYEKLEEDKAVENFFKENGIDEERIFIEEALFYKTQLAAAAKIADVGLSTKDNA